MEEYNTPTKDELNFKGSFIKKSEERRASKIEESEVREQVAFRVENLDQELEPICVLKIELDDEIVEHIKIF
jgi:hypothetical protein